MFMLLTKTIIPIRHVFTKSFHSTKIDMLIRNIFFMTSAIIISILDIYRIHTNNIAIMLIIHAKHFIEFFFYQLSTIFLSIVFTKDIIKMNNMMQPQFYFFCSFLFINQTSDKTRN